MLKNENHLHWFSNMAYLLLKAQAHIKYRYQPINDGQCSPADISYNL